MKPSIKTVTVQYLTNFLLILAVLLTLLTALNFRTLSNRATENQAIAHAELVRAGLTTQMKTESMSECEYYLEELKQVKQIQHLQVFRGEAVNRQYGQRTPISSDHPADTLVQQVLASGEVAVARRELSLHPTSRVVIPYLANHQVGQGCLECHIVEPGALLGAVDIQLDVTEYRNQALLVLMLMVLISLLFVLLIGINTSRTIQHYVLSPLETLVERAMEAYQQHTPLNPEQFDTEEFRRVARGINLFNADLIARENLIQQKNKELLALNNEIESTLRETIYTMGVIEEQRSRETYNHTKRVTLYSQLLAHKLGLSNEDCELLSSAAALHDIGKLGIPDVILLKPSRFSPEERTIMETHTHIGYNMLKHSTRDVLKAAQVITLQHHERWDGSGYPNNLAGDHIHVYARIVGLADVFDALCSKRIYKAAQSPHEVAAWIETQRNQQFDPVLVDIFQDYLMEVIAIHNTYSNDFTYSSDSVDSRLKTMTSSLN